MRTAILLSLLLLSAACSDDEEVILPNDLNGVWQIEVESGNITETAIKATRDSLFLERNGFIPSYSGSSFEARKEYWLDREDIIYGIFTSKLWMDIEYTVIDGEDTSRHEWIAHRIRPLSERDF